MNKQLVAVPGRRDHPPQPAPPPTTDRRPVRRVGVLDRAALHLGVALITWGRRPGRVPRREPFAVSPEGLHNQHSIEKRRETYSLWGSDLTRIR